MLREVSSGWRSASWRALAVSALLIPWSISCRPAARTGDLIGRWRLSSDDGALFGRVSALSGGVPTINLREGGALDFQALPIALGGHDATLGRGLKGTGTWALAGPELSLHVQTLGEQPLETVVVFEVVSAHDGWRLRRGLGDPDARTSYYFVRAVDK